ncbi:MAG: hypothetical protein ACJ8FS_09810 [Sphingomicrobium sp.]
MRKWMAPLLAVALAGCGGAGQSGNQSNITDPPGDVFPAKGNYHLVHDRTQGNGQMAREESDTSLDVSTRAAFEQFIAKPDGSNCRDVQVDVGGGSFSVRMTCDAPDGDIHNIGIERHGSYSKDSIDASEETTLWGMSIRDSVSYRLKS